MAETRETNSVQVKIYKQEYALRTEGDPDRLKALCAVLDKRMHEIAADTGSDDAFELAVLAAISIADDARRAKEATIKLDEAIFRRSTACVSLLTQVFDTDS